MTLSVVHLAFYERTYFLFVFCTSFSRPLLKDIPGLRKDRMTDHFYFSASPLLKNNRSAVWKKKWNKSAHKCQKEVCSGKKKNECGASACLMALLKDFSFDMPDYIPEFTSIYMSEENNVEIQTWMWMQDVSYRLPIVCLCSHFLGFCKDEWRQSMDSRDCWDRFFIENSFFLGTINEHLELTEEMKLLVGERS